KWPYKLLVEQRDKVKDEVGIDVAKQRRYADLQRSFSTDQRSLQRLVAECDNARKAEERKKKLIDHRRSLYVKVIQSYLDEQAILERLYSPLQQILVDASGSLSHLRFTVSREVNLKQWVETGEALLDLRKDSKLRGHGALFREAERILYPAWKT